VEICPSDAISFSRDMSFIQVKQNKISWDKFLQIPANFETSQQIRDWNIPRITQNTIEFKKIFMPRGYTLAFPPAIV
jgi:formate hydrogenlyase subunit 6/NADH:ubiquinone oxidoreductase subunit I